MSASTISRRKAFVLLATVVFAWGITWPLMKLIVATVPPLWATAIRSALAGGVLLAALLGTRNLIVPPRGDLPVIASIALLHMVAFAALIAMGLQLIPAGRSVVLGYTARLWVVPRARLFLGERMTPRRTLGLALGCAGLAWMFNPLAFDWHDSNALLGNGLILLAALCWAINIVHVRAHRWIATPYRTPAKYSTATFTCTESRRLREVARLAARSDNTCLDPRTGAGMVRMSLLTTRIAAGLLTCGALSSHAVQVCELNGQSVNPANVDSSAGKAGLMRCREAEGGPVVREEELREGRFMGIARTWYPNGQLKRVAFRNDNGREEAVVEFTTEGKLAELRCAPRALLAPHADDARWCGHSGVPEAVALHGTSGAAASSVTYERGVLRARETLWPNGKPRQQLTITGQTHIERTFAEDGVKRREIESIRTPSDGTTRPRGLTTRDSEYHESGKLVRERRWAPDTGLLVVEAQWHLNGQPRAKIERLTVEGTTAMRETRFHDNGKPAFVGDYRIMTREPRLPTGVHKRFDVAGYLLEETYHDARGRTTREREFDAQGKVVRDEELFEDGSRKANSR